MSFLQLIQEQESKFVKKLNNTGFDIGVQHDEQRTEEWFQNRKGKFTGSGIKNLMGSTRATSKIEWGRVEKIIDFNETAIKYIYEKAMEIKRNKIVHLQTSRAMRYGTENESISTELFLHDNPHLDFKQVAFIEFIKDIAGSSPDGLLTDTITAERFGFENKCATNWDTVYSRMETPFDEKHQDFWQIQAEMLSLNVNRLYYCIAEPSEDISEPNIENVQWKIVQASRPHQQSIKHRCHIGHSAKQIFLNENKSIHEAVKLAASNYKF